jgi:hypothetical protein
MMSKKRIMRALKINEISGVDRPAQQGALAMIMKRNDSEPQDQETVEKRAMLTASTDGHTHLVFVENGWGELNAGSTDYTNGHTHPWIRTESGQIVIGEAMGHVHAIGEVSKAGKAVEGAMPDGSFPIKNKADLKNAIQAFGRAKDKAATAKHIRARAKALGLEDVLPTEGVLADLLSKSESGAAGENSGNNVGTKEDTMTDKTTAVDKNEAAKVEELTKSLDKANRVLALKGDVREFYDSLEAAKQDEFLTKSTEEQTAEVAKSKDSDPVVYKTADGVEYRKSDDQRLVSLAKQNDELAKAAKESAAKAKEAELRKRASEELSHLPGSEDVRVALLKAVDAIEDEAVRKSALESLKAKDLAMKGAFEQKGHRGSPEAGSSEDELDIMAKAYAKENKVSFEKAYAEVIKTDEGRKLYKKASAE